MKLLSEVVSGKLAVVFKGDLWDIAAGVGMGKLVF